jgi:hypothetical protein
VTTDITFEPATTNAAAAEFVEMLGTAVQLVINSMSESEGFVGPERLTVVVADDFAGEVRARMAYGPDAEAFTTERVGGEVAGKNLPVPRDSGAGVIVLNQACHDFADTATGGQVLGAFTLTHELFHPPLTWTRLASGALAGVEFPSTTPSECARSLVRGLADEYRADMLAATVLQVLAGSDAAQQQLAQGRQELHDRLHRESLTDALDAVVHPGWPDTVMAYRKHRLGFDEMWGRIVSQTDQTFTLLAHAEAAARMAGHPRPLDDPLASHAGVVSYLGPAWEAISDVLVEGPLLPAVRGFHDLEDELLEVGERAIADLWRSLGLAVTEHADRSFYIHVGDPR